MMQRTMTPIAEAFGCHILTFCVGKPGALIIAPEQQRATRERAHSTPITRTQTHLQTISISIKLNVMLMMSIFSVPTAISNVRQNGNTLGVFEDTDIHVKNVARGQLKSVIFFSLSQIG